MGSRESISFACGCGSVFLLYRGVDIDKAYIYAVDNWSEGIGRAVKILGTDESVTTKYENGTLTITNNNTQGLSMAYFLKP